MNNYQKHNIHPVKAFFNTQTEIIEIKSPVSLEDVAIHANVSLSTLGILNPAYKKQVINASEDSPKKLIVPALPTYSYNMLCRMLGVPGRQIPAVPAEKPAPAFVYYITYKVQEGDTVTSIAGKFNGTSVEDIRSANKLDDSLLTPGMILKIKLDKV